MGFLGTLLGGAAGYLLAPATGGMSLLASTALGAGIGSGIDASQAASDAAGAQVDAANRAADLQKQMFDKQVELQSPYREAGLTGQNRLMELLGLGGNTAAQGYGRYAKDFGMGDFQADPGYGFRMSEGMKALDRTAAARGGLISGGALKAAQRFGQDLGSQEYQNAFNRYQTNRTNQLQPLGNLMTLGQNAASNTGSAAQNYGNQAGEAYMGAGNARASGYVGSANALNSALSGGMNYLQNQQYLNMLRPSSAYAPNNADVTIPMQPGGGY